MSTICIIQARMGSTRLPGKVLMLLKGIPVLLHVYRRVCNSKMIDEVVIATTINKEDDDIVNLCKQYNIECYRGSENDVLDRYYECWSNTTYSKIKNPYQYSNIHYDNIVRVTADSPLIDWDIIDKVIEKHLQEGNDLTSNCISESFPDSLDCEIFTYKTLAEMWRNAKLKSEREHVTLYVKNHPELYKIGELKSEINYYNKRWTLDHIEDYNFIKEVYARLYKDNQYFDMNDILKLLEDNPELEKINNHIQRNEGLIKSLKEDEK